MAISWDIEVSKVNVASKRADVRFRQMNDITGDEWFTPVYSQTIIGTPEERTVLFDLAWSYWQKYLEDQEVVNNFISDFEQLGKTNLETREI